MNAVGGGLSALRCACGSSPATLMTSPVDVVHLANACTLKAPIVSPCVLATFPATVTQYVSITMHLIVRVEGFYYFLLYRPFWEWNE
jgi:hypothetical protein